MNKEKKYVKAGCGLLLLVDNKILLGLRNTDAKYADCDLHEEGTWTMPGGSIEFGEDIKEAAIREAYEEAGIIIKNPDIICVQNDKNDYAHYISIGLLATSYEGEITVKEPLEITSWQWFSLDNLPKNIFSPARKTLNCYLQNKFCIDE